MTSQHKPNILTIMSDVHVAPMQEGEITISFNNEYDLTYTVEDGRVQSVKIENVKACAALMVYRIGKKPQTHKTELCGYKIPLNVQELAYGLIDMPVMTELDLSLYIRTQL